MTALRFLAAICLALLLAACAPQGERGIDVLVAPEPVMAETTEPGRVDDSCTPGDTDDGIGGTGCAID